IGVLLLCCLWKVSTYVIEDVSKRVVTNDVNSESKNIQADQKYVDLARQIQTSIKEKALSQDLFINLDQVKDSNNLVTLNVARNSVPNDLNKEMHFYLRLDAALDAVQLSFKYLSYKGNGRWTYWHHTRSMYEWLAEGAYKNLLERHKESQDYDEYLAIALKGIRDELRYIWLENLDGFTAHYYMRKTGEIVKDFKRISANIQEIREALPLNIINQSKTSTFSYLKLDGALSSIQFSFSEFIKSQIAYNQEPYFRIVEVQDQIADGSVDTLDKYINNIYEKPANATLIVALNALKKDLNIKYNSGFTKDYYKNKTRRTIKIFQRSSQKITKIRASLPIER
ncbi:hypothetical protein MJH12_09405, partial [bacterium]|nr:hypothetical protein [bacterium]